MGLIQNWILNNLSPEKVRKYYTKIRKETLRRLSVLEKNDMLDYIDNVPKVTTARGRSFDDVLAETKELNNFLKNQFSSIKKVREFERDMIERLNKAGYDNINSSNIRDYNMIMKELKGDFEAGIYDSDRVTSIFDEAQRLNLDYSPEDFTDTAKLDYMKENIKALRNIKPVKNNKPMTQREMRKRVTQWKNRNS